MPLSLSLLRCLSSLPQCDELDKLIAVDRETELVFESMSKLDMMDADEKKAAKATKERLQAQVKRLQQKKQEKGCSASAAIDAEAIQARIRQGQLKEENVILRAKQDEMFIDNADKMKTTCKELRDILSVDDKAMIRLDQEAKELKKKAQELEAAGDKEGAQKALIQAQENKLIIKRISSTETEVTNSQLQKMCAY